MQRKRRTRATPCRRRRPPRRWPRTSRPRGQARQPQQRAALTEFATALTGFLGAEGLTLQGVGTKLRKVPGFSEAMAAQKITGNGAMERFLALFSDMFVRAGEAQRKRLRRA